MMNDDQIKVRCVATTKSGNQCKNFARPGEQTCFTHRQTKIKKETAATTSEIDGDALQQLVGELDELVTELKAIVPDNVTSSTVSLPAEEILKFVKANLEKVTPDIAKDIAASFQGASREDLMDPETWKGLGYMLNYSLRFQAEQMKQRLMGEAGED